MNPKNATQQIVMVVAALAIALGVYRFFQDPAPDPGDTGSSSSISLSPSNSSGSGSQSVNPATASKDDLRLSLEESYRRFSKDWAENMAEEQDFLRRPHKIEFLYAQAMHVYLQDDVQRCAGYLKELDRLATSIGTPIGSRTQAATARMPSRQASTIQSVEEWTRFRDELKSMIDAIVTELVAKLQ